MHRVHTDFTIAAVEAVKSIASGCIDASFNMYENGELANKVYVYNDVFVWTCDAPRPEYVGFGKTWTHSKYANAELHGMELLMQSNVEGLSTTDFLVIQYEGQKFICQSCVIGVTMYPELTKCVYGRDDANEGRMVVDESVKEAMVKLSKELGISGSTITTATMDGDNETVEMPGPAELRVIQTMDNRQYCMDMYSLLPRDANYSFDENPYAFLRPELRAIYDRKQAIKALVEAQKNRESESEGEGATSETEAEAKAEELKVEPIVLNNDVFSLPSQEFVDKDKAELEKEELLKLSTFLVEECIPELVADIQSSMVSIVDGVSLTERMHEMGINMRYLGRVATQLQGSSYHHNICETEMVGRACKHILRSWLCNLSDRSYVATLYAHFLNCVFGQGFQQASETLAQVTKQAPKLAPEGTTLLGDLAEFAPADVTASLKLTSTQVWKEIQMQIKERFDYELNIATQSLMDNGVLRFPLAVLRSICAKAGVQIDTRDYNFNGSQPFSQDAIVGTVLLMKHPKTYSKHAMDLRRAAQELVTRKQFEGVVPLLMQSLNILVSMFGHLHPECATGYFNLALWSFELNVGGVGQAIDYLKVAITGFERSLGLDHPKTLEGYMHLVKFYRMLGHLQYAIVYQEHVLYSLHLIGGDPNNMYFAEHLNIQGTNYINLGQPLGAIPYLKQSLSILEGLPEATSQQQQSYLTDVMTNTLYSLSMAYSQTEEHQKGIGCLQKMRDLFAKQFDESDDRVQRVDQHIHNLKTMRQNLENRVDPTVGRFGNESVDDLVDFIAGKKKLKKPKANKQMPMDEKIATGVGNAYSMFTFMQAQDPETGEMKTVAVPLSQETLAQMAASQTSQSRGESEASGNSSSSSSGGSKKGKGKKKGGK
eukprot:TRINITY_DN5161_c0_g1_i5.p1 TRINITY_DN5161_c0_g1~~TRINITY_DN5161_c0_g1_i5.p1  ORF type:complete len:883 (+),score=356.08 TRINITY_DN5161_c0_g1_i5:1530-4178(+)